VTLRISHVSAVYESLYTDLLDSIPAGNQWAKGPVTLPLTPDKKTPFIIEGDVGDHVDVFLNNTLISTVILTSPRQEFSLQLVAGKNFVSVRTTSESYLVLVVAVRYAVPLRGYAEDLFFSSWVKFQDAYRQLNSDLSLRAVEHQIEFQRFLPPTRASRLLAGKMAVRSLINEGGTTRGVDDIVTAASNTTPVVVPTELDLGTFEPAVRLLYGTAQDEGGFAFHIWVPSLCLGTWAAFVKLMDNLDPSIAELSSVSDEKVSLSFLGRQESHLFDEERSGCSITSLLTLDCLPITVSVDMTVYATDAFCAWTYPFDVETELALGRTRLDSLSGIRFSYSVGSFSVDTTGSETGVVGASYIDLPVSRLVFASVSDLASGSSILSSVPPGSSRVVLPGGLPAAPVLITGGESLLLLDSGDTLDSCEDADPLCDGWFGLPIEGRFDAGACLDSMSAETSLFEDLSCCFGRPRSTLAVASLLDISLSSPITASASLSVVP